MPEDGLSQHYSKGSPRHGISDWDLFPIMSWKRILARSTGREAEADIEILAMSEASGHRPTPGIQSGSHPASKG